MYVLVRMLGDPHKLAVGDKCTQSPTLIEEMGRKMNRWLAVWGVAKNVKK